MDSCIIDKNADHLVRAEYNTTVEQFGCCIDEALTDGSMKSSGQRGQ